MDEPLLLGLIVAGFIAVSFVVRLSLREPDRRALSRLEAKLDALLKHQGVHFDPYADLDPSVLDAVRRGKKIDAIKAYRAVSGAGLKEAKEYVEELERRASPGT